jgi:hypothetical protein
MKIFTKNDLTDLCNLRQFLGTILTIVLMMTAAALAQSSPAPVDLGTSGNFVILAKTGISTTGVTSITGDIGVSPIDHTAITGFDLILDPSGQWATSTLVVGKVYAADYATPTPTMLSTAVGNMETAYTDAAGRTPDYTELYSGDITGQTLTTGTYKWSTGVLISPGGVTISGSATDVWIFQIAQDLTVANGAIITLSGGAKASNIFWQVAGEVTLGTSSDFKGIILSQTLIAMQTGATFDGKALAQTAVTLDANSVLPVELNSFSAVNKGMEILLEWVTATETNNRQFEIYRRSILNEKTGEWMLIGHQEGNGTTTESKYYSYEDNITGINANALEYRLKQIDYNGSYTYSEIISVNSLAPNGFVLGQNYPNPFNPSTNIHYSLGNAGVVLLKIYNLLGSEVVTLVNKYQEAGSYTVKFNTNQGKFNLPSGLYFYRLQAGSFISVKKMILMK